MMSSEDDHQSSSEGEDRKSTLFEKSKPRAEEGRVRPVPGAPYIEHGDHFGRPNSFHGPTSTWRSWTKADRLVAESMDQARSQDLSIHLYNAHNFRRRARKLQREDQQMWERSLPTSEGSGEDTDFKPPKRWTAWPMPSGEVPRATYGKLPSDMRPSAELEETLVATISRFARHRWNSRDWDEVRGGQGQGEGSPMPTTPEADFDPQEGIENISGLQVFSSQAFEMGEASPLGKSMSEPDHDQRDVEASARPVPSADDNKGRRILCPPARHIISQLDNLLLGLHHARQAYATSNTTTHERSKIGSASESSRSTSRGHDRQQGRMKKRQRSSTHTADSEASTRSCMTQRTKSMRSSRTRSADVQLDRLGLRDWSDVLGMATLTDWNENVVARAGERCAKIFGEDMLFRKFFEPSARFGTSYFTETFASGVEAARSEEGARVEANGAETNPYTTGGSNWSHFCPHEDCPRNKQPFKQAGNLQQHLNQCHVQFFSADERVGVPHTDTGIKATKEAYCPIVSCHRHQTPFSIGSKLYLHLRRMHPEVNVEEIKRLESKRKGETRGKWSGEKRKRNPYDRVRH